MEKAKLLLVAITLITSLNLTTAQVSINTDGSDADPSAGLDVNFNNKGFLAPRMTQAEIAAIPSPANGLQAFNTDNGKMYIFVLADNVWKEVQYGSGEIILPASFSIGAGGSCANTTVNGTYTEAVALDGSNTVNLDATVTTTGTWSITTNTVNGYSFSGSGTFTTTGTVQVTLDGTGTPTIFQTDNFTATANGSGGNCTFDVTVAPSTVYNLVTGETWMNRNLGATQVATSSTDAAAYGDLYQWGRYSEGHEVRTSGTISVSANTPVPNAGNPWDGLFITQSQWEGIQTNTLWQGASGTNNPCPDGFRLPTSAEWEAERLSWVSNDAAGAFGSPLKIPTAGWRDEDGTIIDAAGWGALWSSTVNGIYSKNMQFNSGSAYPNNLWRGHGCSVRCIQD